MLFFKINEKLYYFVCIKKLYILSVVYERVNEDNSPLNIYIYIYYRKHDNKYKYIILIYIF